MKKVFTSTLLTVAAVPFLMAAPAAKKVQNQPPATNSAKTVNTKKTTKKHVKKSKANSETPATSAAPQK
jgi:hypothetical protein